MDYDLASLAQGTLVCLTTLSAFIFLLLFCIILRLIDPARNKKMVEARELDKTAEGQTLKNILAPSLASSDQNLQQVNTLSHIPLGDDGSGAATVGTQKPSTNQGFALQDKLWSIYAAGNTIPIPFLKAADISPLALISNRVNRGRQLKGGGSFALEAVQELYSGEGQPKKGRRSQNNEGPLPKGVSQRLATSSTLRNLVQALAYHKMCYEEMPLQGLQAAQEQQTIQNLSDTLRTILRL